MTDPLEIFRNLARAPRPDGRFVVEGELAVGRLLESSFAVETIVCTAGARSRLAIPAGVEVIELANAALRELVGFDFHRGALASARRPTSWTLPADLLERPRLTIVIAERVADPHNLGALLRNARAFGVDAVLVDSQCADPLSRVAIRASMGNVFRIPLAVVAALPERVAALREHGVAIVAATPDPGAESLHELERRRPAKLALLLGNEGDGLSSSLFAQADLEVRIPIAAAADSLNVAAATAVLLYALQR